MCELLDLGGKKKVEADTVFLFKTFFVTDAGVAFMQVRETPRRPKCIFDKDVYVAISKKNWSSKPRCHNLPQQLHVCCSVYSQVKWVSVILTLG